MGQRKIADLIRDSKKSRQVQAIETLALIKAEDILRAGKTRPSIGKTCRHITEDVSSTNTSNGTGEPRGHPSSQPSLEMRGVAFSPYPVEDTENSDGPPVISGTPVVFGDKRDTGGCPETGKDAPIGSGEQGGELAQMEHRQRT